jgi:hypothetical protein
MQSGIALGPMADLPFCKTGDQELGIWDWGNWPQPKISLFLASSRNSEQKNNGASY